MYVTRPLSWYQADASAAAEVPPEGPGSGFLVVVDETGETARTHFWGLCVDREMRGLPFPQNRQLALRPSSGSDPIESVATAVDVVGAIADFATSSMPGRAPGLSKGPKMPDYTMLVPVVGQPLSSGRYYVVRADGKHRGKVSACSKEEDKTDLRWLGSYVNDVKPRAFDRSDLYQQVEVQQLPSNAFKAVAVAADGIPPHFLSLSLRKKGWKVNTMVSPKYQLTDDAQGVDSTLCCRMPDLGSLSIAERSSPAVVVGRWYVSFIFVKADGGRSLKDQFRRCTFYEMTMEQSWEQIYSHDNPGSKPAEVVVTATVRRSTALLDGASVVPQEVGGVVWFGSAVCLDMVVWERMKWELERGGWVAPGPGNGNEERVERVDRRDRLGQWHRFACYVLVERFVLKRMDGSLALTCVFRHTDKIKTKWL
ncbi:uncharacterized protein [Triticum aestivum]|uniref:uncharacterized protein n=1 Tax=Triticum aestivum TaxID=4565 RepID=UPI001D01B1B6|nr:uncharacterized protein LOC123171288 [Triticum aestivum]